MPIWLQIVASVATIINTSLAVFRMFKERPKPTPTVNQPKSRTQKILGWIDHLVPDGAVPWVLGISVLICLAALVVELHSAKPLDRSALGDIVFWLTLFILNLVFFFLLRMAELIVELKVDMHTVFSLLPPRRKDD